jgi:hypothetical protein
MGWTFQLHGRETSNRQAWENEFKNPINNGPKLELIDYAFRAFDSRCWAVWKVKETGLTFITVTLIDRKMEDGCPNIGFKDIDVAAGPYYYDCPAKFIKMLGNDDLGLTYIGWLEKWINAKERKAAKKKLLAVA